MKKYYTMIGGIERVYHNTLDDAKQYCDEHYCSAFANGKNLQVIWTDNGDDSDMHDKIWRELYTVRGMDRIGTVRRTAWHVG